MGLEDLKDEFERNFGQISNDSIQLTDAINIKEGSISLSTNFLKIFDVIAKAFNEFNSQDSITKFLVTKNGIFVLILVFIALYYLLLSFKFPRLSMIPLISVFVYTILIHFKDQVETYAQYIGIEIAKIVPPESEYLPTSFPAIIETETLGYIIIALIISILFCYFAVYGFYIGLVVVFYFLQIHFKTTLLAEQSFFEYSNFVFAFLCVVVMYLIVKNLSCKIIIIISSMIFSIITLIATSVIFQIPKEFLSFLSNLLYGNLQDILNQPQFIYLFLLATFSMLFQHKILYSN